MAHCEILMKLPIPREGTKTLLSYLSQPLSTFNQDEIMCIVLYNIDKVMVSFEVYAFLKSLAKHTQSIYYYYVYMISTMISKVSLKIRF